MTGDTPALCDPIIPNLPVLQVVRRARGSGGTPLPSSCRCRSRAIVVQQAHAIGEVIGIALLVAHAEEAQLRGGRQAGVLVGEAGDDRPVGLGKALGQGGDEAVVHETGQGQGDGGLLGGGQQQPVVLEAEREFEARRLEPVGGDQAAVGSIDRGGKQRAHQEVEKGLCVQAGPRSIGQFRARRREEAYLRMAAAGLGKPEPSGGDVISR
jgi:hypothetical protein